MKNKAKSCFACGSPFPRHDKKCVVWLSPNPNEAVILNERARSVPFDFDRVWNWAQDPNKKSAELSFTEGVERNVCRVAERAIQCFREMLIEEIKNRPHGKSLYINAEQFNGASLMKNAILDVVKSAGMGK